MKSGKTTRIIFIVLVALALVGVSLAINKFTNRKDDFHFRPEIFISGVSIEDSDERYLRVYPTLHIVNDLGVEARVRELEYELKQDNRRVLTNLEKKNFVIRKQDTSQVTLAMRIDKKDLEQLNARIADITDDSARFNLRLLFKLDVPLRGYREFEVVRDVDLPLLRVLVVESRKLSLEKFSLNHPELKMRLKLRNPNSFPIIINQCNLDLSVGDDLSLTGKANGVQRLEPKSTEDISVELNVDDIQPASLAWKSLFKDDKTPFRSRISFRVISENKMLNRSRFVILKNGMLEELKGGQ